MNFALVVPPLVLKTGAIEPGRTSRLARRNRFRTEEAFAGTLSVGFGAATPSWLHLLVHVEALAGRA